MINHPGQDMRHQVLPESTTNNRLQYFAITRNREMTRLTQTSTELKSGVSGKIIGLNPHPNPTLTQIKHRPFLNLLLYLIYTLPSLTNLHLIINGEVELLTTLSLV